MTIIREALTRWGFQVDDKKVDDFEKKLTSTIKTAALVTGAVAVVGAGMLKLAQDAATAGDNAAKTARNIGITAESLQELRHAAALSGIETDQLTDGLKDLQKNSAAAALGDEGLAKAFKALGINAKEFNKLSADKKLEGIADGLQRIKDPARAAQLRMQLLGETGFKMQSLLAGGSDGIKAMRAEARQLGIVLAEDTTVKAEAMNDALDRVRLIGRGVALQLGARLIPMITAAAGVMKDWLLENRAFVMGGLEAAIDGAAQGFSALFTIVRAVGGGVSWMVKQLGGMNKALFFAKFLLATFVTYQAGAALWGLIQTVQAAIVAYRTLGATALIAQLKAIALPVAIAALVVILGLLVDDFAAFFSGQKSGIGELVKLWPALGEALWFLHDVWGEAGKVAEEFFDWAIAAWPRFSDAAWEAIMSVIDSWNDLEVQIPAAFERAKQGALEVLDDLVREAARRVAGVIARVEIVADKLGLDSGELRAVRTGLEAVGTPLYGARAARGAEPRAMRATAAARAAGGAGGTREGDTYNVTQLPGEDGEAFARRVGEITRRNRASEMRQTAASVDAGIAW